MAEDPHNRQQVEPTIAVHPLNPNIIVAGAQDLRLVGEPGHHNRWHGYYRSTDRGRTWSVSLLPGFPGDVSAEGRNSPLRFFDATTDPVLAMDRSGNAFYAGIAFNTDPVDDTPIGLSQKVFVAKYTGDGATYDSAIVLDGTVYGTFHDKEWIAIDNSGGNNNGHVYLVWNAVTIEGVLTSIFASSTDHGATFSLPTEVPDRTSAFAYIAVDQSSGRVYVAAMSQEFPFPILVSRSDDGGTSFTTHEAPKPVGITGLPDNDFRVGTLPVIAADSIGVYLAWADFSTGDADILFSRSTDGGVTWSRPITINDDTTNHQFDPSITASSGRLELIWYDSRLDYGGKIAELDVYYAQSLDRGRSFLPNIRVTAESFDPNLVPRSVEPGASDPFIGDYIQLSSDGTSSHAIWADNTNADPLAEEDTGLLDQDVFTTRIAFCPAGIGIAAVRAAIFDC